MPMINASCVWLMPLCYWNANNKVVVYMLEFAMNVTVDSSSVYMFLIEVECLSHICLIHIPSIFMSHLYICFYMLIIYMSVCVCVCFSLLWICSIDLPSVYIVLIAMFLILSMSAHMLCSTYMPSIDMFVLKVESLFIVECLLSHMFVICLVHNIVACYHYTCQPMMMRMR